jgi:hypothetical protein
MVLLPKQILLSLLPFYLASSVSGAASGSGTTTRYWDCCKPSCAWSKKISLKSGATPVVTCDKNDNPLSNFDTKSICDNGGTAYMCSNESPWAVSDTLSYGYAAVSIAGGNEASWCCACYELTFTSGPVQGKKLIVQATNTGGDLSQNQFDLSVSFFLPCVTFHYNPPCSLHLSRKPCSNRPSDPRWRRRHLQRLHLAIWNPIHGLGPAIRRCLLALRLRLIPRKTQGGVLLALRLVSRS